MIKSLLLVGIGGFLGSVARFATSSYLTKMIPSMFPFGTLAVNIIGCFLIGIIYGASLRFQWFSPAWSFFLATGFCGGYTTFSAFAFENIRLLETSNYTILAFNLLLSVGGGLLAVFLGLLITKI